MTIRLCVAAVEVKLRGIMCQTAEVKWHAAVEGRSPFFNLTHMQLRVGFAKTHTLGYDEVATRVVVRCGMFLSVDSVNLSVKAPRQRPPFKYTSNTVINL